MKTLAWLVGAVLALVLVVGLAQLVASETGEVVVLTTHDADGEHDTRLWVVDLDDHAWLRGGPGSGWYGRLSRDPAVRLSRGGEERDYVAQPVAGMAGTINALMAEKYGWRDRVVSLTAGDRSDAVVVRLVPAD